MQQDFTTLLQEEYQAFVTSLMSKLQSSDLEFMPLSVEVQFKNLDLTQSDDSPLKVNVEFDLPPITMKLCVDDYGNVYTGDC